MDPVSGASTSTVDQQDAIDQFVDLAGRKLDSNGIFEWVTSGEVVDVNNALIALQNEHGNDAADAALDELADAGLLDTFVEEMYGAGTGGSVSADGRATIFSNIAKIADGETQAKFANSLESTTNGADGYSRLEDFAESLATHASPQDKVEFIETLADESTKGRSSDYSGSFFSTSIEGDPQAMAIATVLGSTQGVFAQEALNALSPDQLNAVVDASIEQRATISSGGGHSGGSTSGSVDASKFADLANVVAQHGNIEQKAQVFDIAGNQVDGIADASSFFAPVSGTEQAAADITDGLTDILTSDTNAVVEELTYDRRFDDGRALTNYAEQLIETEQTDKISSIQVQLMLGNDGAGNHVQRFNEVGADGVATNAGKLGNFSGAVQNAVDNIDATSAEKQALVTDVIGTTSSILGGTLGLAFPVAGFAVGVGGEAAKRGVDQLLDSPRASIDEQIIDLAVPFNTTTNNVNRTSIAFSEFQDMIDQVENANRRNGN